MARRKEYLPLSNPDAQLYHDAYDNYRMTSRILNSGNQPAGAYMIFIEDRNTLLTEKDQCIDRIIFLEERIKKIENKFLEYQKERMKQGWPAPEEMVKEMRDEYQRTQAKLDVSNEELTAINNLFEKLHGEPERKTRNRKVLQYGIQQASSLRDGETVQVDGQEVEYIQGKRVITEPESPYRGMQLHDYRKLPIRRKKQGESVCVDWRRNPELLPPWPKDAKPVELRKNA